MKINHSNITSLIEFRIKMSVTLHQNKLIKPQKVLGRTINDCIITFTKKYFQYDIYESNISIMTYINTNQYQLIKISTEYLQYFRKNMSRKN